jgi:hypothetical protein
VASEENPYRGLPIYRDRKTGLLEAAVCRWCAWGRAGSGFLVTHDRCYHPLNQDGFHHGEPHHFNPQGACMRYQASRWTRFLIFTGFRGRVWRDPPDDSKPDKPDPKAVWSYTDSTGRGRK